MEFSALWTREIAWFLWFLWFLWRARQRREPTCANYPDADGLAACDGGAVFHDPAFAAHFTSPIALPVPVAKKRNMGNWRAAPLSPRDDAWNSKWHSSSRNGTLFRRALTLLTP
jgi:hypothetical protein